MLGRDPRGSLAAPPWDFTLRKAENVVSAWLDCASLPGNAGRIRFSLCIISGLKQPPRFLANSAQHRKPPPSENPRREKGAHGTFVLSGYCCADCILYHAFTILIVRRLLSNFKDISQKREKSKLPAAQRHPGSRGDVVQNCINHYQRHTKQRGVCLLESNLATCLRAIKMSTSCDPVIPLPGMCPEEVIQRRERL